MAQITASMVKALRDKTSAGMMDCKKALTETDGNIEEAISWLRKKGLASAAKKAGRTAADGLIAVVSDGSAASIIEVNSETDFVARNEQFQLFTKTVCQLTLETKKSIDDLKAHTYPGSSHTVDEELTNLIATIGENISLRRNAHLDVSDGLMGSYVHNAVMAGLGKIGVLVSLEGSHPEQETIAKQIAMHIAASSPLALDEASLDSSLVQKERDIYREKALASGKPENVVEKMIEGQIKKFQKENCLVDQLFVIDTKKTVGQAVAEYGLTISAFIRYELGEGIEKKEDDFAAEVAKAVQ